ncbi:MAG: FtsX-like permease family protein [Bdellovibrio sp.]
MVFKIALRNLQSNIRYSLMALLAIGGGFVSFVVFNGYIADAYSLIEDEIRHRMMYGDVVIEDAHLSSPEARASSWEYLVSHEQQQMVATWLKESSYPVRATAPFLPFSGLVSNGGSEALFIGLGLDVEASRALRGAKWERNVVAGKTLPGSSDSPGAILGEGLARLMGCHIQGEKRSEQASVGCDRTTELQLSGMTVANQINAVDVDVIGVTNAGFKEMDRRYVMTSLESAQILMNTQGVGYISVMLNDRSQGPALAENLNAVFREKQSSLQAYHWQQHPIAGDLYHKTKEILTIFQVFIVTVIVVIVGLSVFNTFVKIVLERTKEIGTLQSMGFTKIQIVQFFMAEAFLLASFGSAVGAVASLLVSGLIQLMRVEYNAGLFQDAVILRIKFVPTDYIIGLVFMCVLAALATYLALRVTLRRRIVDNLNHA